MKFDDLDKLRNDDVAVYNTNYTGDTVAAMRQLIINSKHSPGVRSMVEQILLGLPEKSWQLEIQALFDYVRDHIRYMQDINGIETVKTPDRLLLEIKTYGMASGDCDDHTVLLGSLLVNAGYNVQIAIIQSPWNTGGSFNHVYLRVNVPMSNTWIALDPIVKNQPAGFEATYVKRLLYDV